jgi:hypothetical protein
MLDPKGTRKVALILKDMKQYMHAFNAFHDQHVESNKAIVDSWTLMHYLDAMVNFHVVARIVKKDECWGEFLYSSSATAKHASFVAAVRTIWLGAWC